MSGPPKPLRGKCKEWANSLEPVVSYWREWANTQSTPLRNKDIRGGAAGPGWLPSLAGLGPNGLEVLGPGDTAGRQGRFGKAGVFLLGEEQRRREELEALKSAGPSERPLKHCMTASCYCLLYPAPRGRDRRGEEPGSRTPIFRLAR